MNFSVPANALPRLQALIENATDTDGSTPLSVSFEIRHQDGAEPSKKEIQELRAVLLGYAADGPYDGDIEAGSTL